MSNSDGFFERRFKLKEHNTDAKTEILAGITTFMTMAYILVVNPIILSEAGMDWGGVFTATVVSSIIATLIMAFYANYPFALAPGMGLNAFFTYYVVSQLGKSWQFALTAVFLEGIIFIILSLFKVREAIFNAIPMNLKKAVSVGIGLFIALIGFANAGIVVADKDTMVKLGTLTDRGPISVNRIIIIGVLLAKNVKGALLYGILIATVIGIPMGITEVPTEFLKRPSVSQVAFQFEWSEIFTWEMLIIVFTLYCRCI